MSITIETTQSDGPDPTGSRKTNAIETERLINLKHQGKVVQKVEADKLAGELRSVIAGEVRFDHGSRALYATDGSNYRQIPIGVVIPKTVDDVLKTVHLAKKYNAPILSRGGGTSLAGQCCNVAVILDFSKYLNRVLEIDPDKKLGTVEPGCILDDLRHTAENSHGLTFGPDPATHNHCTLGGMAGNDSCGIHSVMAQFRGGGPRTADNIEEMEILLYDGTRLTVGKTSEEELAQIIAAGGRKGEIYQQLKDLRDDYADQIRGKFPNIPRRVSGYNLPYLLPENGFHVARALVGSEGTCVTILRITTNLLEEPKGRSLLVLGYPDVFAAGAHVPQIMAHQPIGCEGIDHTLIHYNKQKGMNLKDLALLPDGDGFLLVEFGGESKEDADNQARRLMDELKKEDDAPTMKLYDHFEQEQMIWEVRESGLGATAFVPDLPDMWPGWEDSAVPPEKVGDYLQDLKKLFHKHGMKASVYGHFGQGCIHCRLPFDLTSHQGIADYRVFVEEAADLVITYGGSLSGEHGDGQSRAELLPKMYGAEIVTAFEKFKAIFDPENRMNPGKVVHPYKITENLRLGTDYNPPNPKTHFQFPNDDGTFARAALRCVGVGKCRRLEGGTMCPSFMVTREEKHSTRGRARLLFEMLQGDAIHDGWKSEPVKEALDLCLACKGCKGDCPVNVDMATYKAEFLSHYYDGRIRPRSAYAFGLIDKWCRIAAPIAPLVNLVTHFPGLRSVAKWAAGVAPEREVPQFAPETFISWFRRRGNKNAGATSVILWPDTFNNHFHPTTAQAATEVLEAAGFAVQVPQQMLCCGRPLYDYGMLEKAKGYLQTVLEALRPQIRSGVPVVVLEPSCYAVFKDEMMNLFPQDEDAQRLNRQVFLLGEFLDEKASDFEIPKLKRKALLHGHCHHKALLSLHGEESILSKMGVEVTAPEDGCCGMAGSFGFEAGERFKTAQQCGERVLLPKVREASDETLIIADGFSCREQIQQNTERGALHIAQVIQMALHEGESGSPKRRPENGYLKEKPQAYARAIARTTLIVGAAGVAGALLIGMARSWNLRRK